MRQVTAIKPEWLLDIAPHYYKAKDIAGGGGAGGDDGKKLPKTQGKSSAAPGPSEGFERMPPVPG